MNKHETHFSKPAFTSPLTLSTTPTNLNTLPSLLASFRIWSNSASNSGSLFKNSSPVGIPSRAGGMRDAVWTDAKDCNDGSDEEPIVRERIVSFRATSKPFRSSAGWGSLLSDWYQKEIQWEFKTNTHRVAFFTSYADNRGEAGAVWRTSREFIEDVTHCTREYTFNLLDLMYFLLSRKP